MPRQRARPWVGFIPAGFSLLAVILVLVVIFGGVNSRLTSVYYLEIDLSGLKIPSSLEGSTFLQDISQISGADFIGSAATAASLGLADSYTISLVTSCGHFPNSNNNHGGTLCSPARLGFSFQPLTDLRLAATSLAATLSPDLISTVNTYAATSHFLAFAYLSSALLALVAPPMVFCSPALAAGASSLATALLFAASIAATVVFGHLNAAFNASFNAVGMRSASGSVPVALSFVAATLSLVASGVLIARARRTGSRGKRSVVAYNVGGKDAAGLLGGVDAGGDGDDDRKGGGDIKGASSNTKKSGLWGRIPSFARHKYVQLEKQQQQQGPTLVFTDAAGRDHDDVMPGREGPGYRGDEDDSWAAQDDYSHAPSRRDVSPHGAVGGTGDEARIPMVAVGGRKGTMDVNTAYEPYSTPSS